MKDPIVDEVSKARQDHAQKFNHDLTAICDDLKKLISLPPKLITKTSSRTQTSDLS